MLTISISITICIFIFIFFYEKAKSRVKDMSLPFRPVILIGIITGGIIGFVLAIELDMKTQTKIESIKKLETICDNNIVIYDLNQETFIVYYLENDNLEILKLSKETKITYNKGKNGYLKIYENKPISSEIINLFAIDFYSKKIYEIDIPENCIKFLIN